MYIHIHKKKIITETFAYYLPLNCNSLWVMFTCVKQRSALTLYNEMLCGHEKQVRGCHLTFYLCCFSLRCWYNEFLKVSTVLCQTRQISFKQRVKWLCKTSEELIGGGQDRVILNILHKPMVGWECPQFLEISVRNFNLWGLNWKALSVF